MQSSPLIHQVGDHFVCFVPCIFLGPTQPKRQSAEFKRIANTSEPQPEVGTGINYKTDFRDCRFFITAPRTNAAIHPLDIVCTLERLDSFWLHLSPESRRLGRRSCFGIRSLAIKFHIFIKEGFCFEVSTAEDSSQCLHLPRSLYIWRGLLARFRGLVLQIHG